MLLNLSVPPHYADRRVKALVLVVNESAARRASVVRALQDEAFDVLEADSGESALAVSEDMALDAVVVDVHLPDMDGFALCRRLKAASTCLLPVLHLSAGIPSDEARAHGLEAGADGFLPRPFDANALRAAVSTLVRLKHQDSERQAHSAATSLLQDALDALTTHVALLSASGGVVAVNRAWIEFAATNGYSDGGTGFGANYLEVCDRATGEGAEDARAAGVGIRRVLAGEIDHFELDYSCHAPAKERWFHLTVQRMSRPDQVAAIVTHTDRTAEHSRTENDARFRRFVETTNEGVLAMDVAGLITYANPRMESLIGYSPDELHGRSFFDFLQPEEVAEARARFTRRRDGDSSGVEVRARRRDGAMVDVLATESAIVDYQGNIVGVLAMITDVTERRRSELAMAAALHAADMDRRRLTATLEAIPVGVGLSDASGRFTHTNSAVDRIWRGKTSRPYALTQNDAYQAWWPRSGALVAPEEWALARTLASGETISGEIVKIQRLDGTHGYILNSSAPILDAQGTLTGALFVNVDITEQQSEAHERERLLASLDVERTWLAAVFEQAPAFLAVLRGPDHVFERVNPAYQHLIGDRSVIGKSLVDALPEIAGQGLLELLDQVLLTGEPFVGAQLPVRIARAPGAPLETRYLDFVYQRLRDVAGDDVLVAHGVDVTAQVIATQELQRNQQQLREQFAKLPVPTYLWEVRGNDFALIDFNDAARSAIPAFTADTIGKLRSEIFHAATGDAEHLRRALRDDVVVHVAVEVDVGPPLGRRLHHLTLGPQQPDRVLVHAEDTTELVELETQLRQAQKLDALGRLAGGIAHDFNNLLGVMMSYTGILLEELAPSDPIAADLGEVQSAIERAAALTAQLLAFGRQLPLRPQLVDIRDVLSTSERLLQRIIGEDIAVTLDLDGPEPLLVMVDVSQLEQVVLNLAVNARDAMPNGGALRVSVEHTMVSAAEAARHGVASGQYVRLTVQDTGIGIDPETKLRMFDPFFTTKEIGKGTGLGLATVYGIVNQSSGFIVVDSAVGEGATFHVYLPVAPADSARLTPAHASMSVIRPERRIVVLLVEDEEGLRRVTERVLRKYGYDVITAALPEEALSLVLDGGMEFDCLVTDVVMPGMSGQELAGKIRELRGPVPVLLLSGYARDAVERRGIVDADTPLLHKPVKPSDLANAIAELLHAPLPDMRP